MTVNPEVYMEAGTVKDNAASIAHQSQEAKEDRRGMLVRHLRQAAALAAAQLLVAAQLMVQRSLQPQATRLQVSHQALVPRMCRCKGATLASHDTKTLRGFPKRHFQAILYMSNVRLALPPLMVAVVYNRASSSAPVCIIMQRLT